MELITKTAHLLQRQIREDPSPVWNHKYRFTSVFVYFINWSQRRLAALPGVRSCTPVERSVEGLETLGVPLTHRHPPPPSAPRTMSAVHHRGQWEGVLNENRAGSASNAEDFTRQFMQNMRGCGGKPGFGSSGTKPFSYTAGGIKHSPGSKQPEMSSKSQMDGRIGNVEHQLRSPLHYGPGSHSYSATDQNDHNVVLEPVGKKTLTFTTSSYKAPPPVRQAPSPSRPSPVFGSAPVSRPVYHKPQRKIVYNGAPMVATYNSAKDLYSADNLDKAWGQVEEYVQAKRGKPKPSGGLPNSETLKMVRFMDDNGDTPDWARRRNSTGAMESPETGLSYNSPTQSASFKLLQRALDTDDTDGSPAPIQPPVRSSSKPVKPIMKKPQTSPVPQRTNSFSGLPKPQPKVVPISFSENEWKNKLNQNPVAAANNAQDFTKQFMSDMYGGNKPNVPANENPTVYATNYPFANETPLQSGRNIPITLTNQPSQPTSVSQPRQGVDQPTKVFQPRQGVDQPKMATYNSPAKLYSQPNLIEQQQIMRPAPGGPRQPQVKRMAGNYAVNPKSTHHKGSFIWPPPDSQEHNWRATATPLYIDPSHPVIETR
ncbi:uncharacterized protein LOC131891450 isoform X2 [Tigriopus californicus]|uniref:uncharacterized protein LOC131891450 isoform X2 n=1 Tax=Tigriopus californicus TaxID=6832 RepID=UPI0027DA0F64|nr:uncharacterized protein LOC131891450 isoform X2 [Tigriopus californicus]